MAQVGTSTAMDKSERRRSDEPIDGSKKSQKPSSKTKPKSQEKMAPRRRRMLLRKMLKRMLRKVEDRLLLVIRVARRGKNTSPIAVPIGHFGRGADTVCVAVRSPARTEDRQRKDGNSLEKAAYPRYP
jgi:hypothetical protein